MATKRIHERAKDYAYEEIKRGVLRRKSENPIINKEEIFSADNVFDEISEVKKIDPRTMRR